MVGLLFLLVGCAENSFVSQSTDKQKYKQLGESDIKEGKKESALENFLKYAKLAPDDWYAWNRLGWTYYKLEQYQDAITQFEKSNSLANKSVNYLWLGWSYNRLGKYEKAIENCSDCVRLSPNWESGYNCLGWNYYFQGRYHLAIQEFEKAISKKIILQTYNGMGLAYSSLGQYDKALDYVLKAVNMAADGSKLKYVLHLNTAMVHLAKGQYSEAMRIIGETKSNTFLEIKLLGISTKSGNPSGRFVQQVFKNGPADTAQLVSGDILMEIDGESLKNSKYEQFRAMLSRKRFGSNIKAKIMRDGVVRDKYIPLGITADLKQWRPKARRKAKELYEKGNASYEKKEFDTAILHYQEAIAYEDNFAPLFYNLGMAQMAVGENAQAVGNLKIYLQMRPDGASAIEVRKILEKIQK